MRFARLSLSLILLAGLPMSPHAEEAPKTDKPADAPEKKKTEAVDFRKIKELLPEELIGLKRTKADGRKVETGEYSISQVDASYDKETDKDDAPHVGVLIMDFADHQEFANATESWAHVKIDEENDDGYRRTIKVAGQPALETWNKDDASGSVQIYAAGRFLVTVSFEHVPADQFQKAAKALPIEKLIALAKNAKAK